MIKRKKNTNINHTTIKGHILEVWLLVFRFYKTLKVEYQQHIKSITQLLLVYVLLQWYRVFFSFSHKQRSLLLPIDWLHIVADWLITYFSIDLPKWVLSKDIASTHKNSRTFPGQKLQIQGLIDTSIIFTNISQQLQYLSSNFL